MSRKDYTAIATIMQTVHYNNDRPTAKIVAELLADYFERDNPRFDRDKFYEACGI